MTVELEYLRNQNAQVISHFNNIASLYEQEVPSHIRAHLLKKFWKLSSPWVPANSKFLDIGCGHGMHVAFLNSKSIRANGIDASEQMISAAKKLHPDLKDCLSHGDATQLKFESNTFDTASLIGVLHHLPDFYSQLTAIKEALRVVKPGGHILIRECNHINPLFKIYWNFIFPLTSRIDKFGGENWISAKQIYRNFPENTIYHTFFTFIANVSPKTLFPIMRTIESSLEKSFIRSFAAHYLVVLRK